MAHVRAAPQPVYCPKSQSLEFQPAQASVAYSISRTVLPHQDTQLRGSGLDHDHCDVRFPARAPTDPLASLAAQLTQEIYLDPASQARVHNAHTQSWLLATTHMRGETDLTRMCCNIVSPSPDLIPPYP